MVKPSRLSLCQETRPCNFPLITKSQSPRGNTNMPNTSKNNRFYLISVIEHTHLVPCPSVSTPAPSLFLLTLVKSSGRMSQEGLWER